MLKSYKKRRVDKQSILTLKFNTEQQLYELTFILCKQLFLKTKSLFAKVVKKKVVNL